MIISLQDQINEMPETMQKKENTDRQNAKNSDKRSLLIHYMEMVSSQMKMKEHPSCHSLFVDFRIWHHVHHLL